MRTLLVAFLLAGCAAAQNSDLGLLVGVSGPKGQTVVGGGVVSASGSVTPSFQANYAWQVLQRAVDLYVELPLVIPVRVNGSAVVSGGTVAAAGNDGPDVFFTPGARVKFSPESRVSLYVAAGAGVASFSGTASVTLAPLTVATGSRKNSAAFEFGGGVDFRLTRLLSLRVDARDFVTEAGLGGVTGRNHAILQGGIAFHF